MQKVEIPWGAWHGSKKKELNFPKNWKVTMAPMADREDVTQAEIRRAFANPIGQEPIRKLAEGKKTAAIAVDDLTRPTQAFRFLPFIVDELKEGASARRALKSLWRSVATGR